MKKKVTAASRARSLAIKYRRERDEVVNALRFLVRALDADLSSVLALQHAKFILRRYPVKVPK